MFISGASLFPIETLHLKLCSKILSFRKKQIADVTYKSAPVVDEIF